LPFSLESLEKVERNSLKDAIFSTYIFDHFA
jgi:hypothetical protein